jgi:hypothetical protein
MYNYLGSSNTFSAPNPAQDEVGRSSSVLSYVSEMNSNAGATGTEEVADVTEGRELGRKRFESTGAPGEQALELCCGTY